MRVYDRLLDITHNFIFRFGRKECIILFYNPVGNVYNFILYLTASGHYSIIINKLPAIALLTLPLAIRNYSAESCLTFYSLLVSIEAAMMKYIISDPQIMGGAAVIRGTRVPIEVI